MSHLNSRSLLIWITAATILAGTTLVSTPTFADPLGYATQFRTSQHVVEPILSDSGAATEPPDATEIPSHLRRRTVDYPTRESAGTIIIDTPNTYLYYVLGRGRAVRYGIGVGREGFTWAGTQNVVRKQEWPDWHPPAEMIERQPYLPRMMAGGPGNPLGARAMYLGNTVYRIHGTNAPDTIGKRVSSGCIRLTNDDVADLYEHVSVGTRVVVLPMRPTGSAGLVERSRPVSTSIRPGAVFTDGSGAHRLY